MRIVDVMYVYDDKLATPKEQLQQHYTTVGWAEALAKKGAEVIVLKRFHQEASLKLNGVQYDFINDHFKENLLGWQIPWKLLRKIVSLEPDVVLLHEFSRSIQTFLLRKLLKKKTAVVIQHHGGPIVHGIKKSLHDRFNSVADGYFFTTVCQGEQWFRNKKLHSKILPVMEGATFFNYDSRNAGEMCCYQDRSVSRKLTKMIGEPVFLWVGRLDENKDPLTVLDGFELVFEKLPNAALYMIYSEDKLIREVRKKISDYAILKSRVHLVGKIPHEEIQAWYQSADYFVLGSHYEGSGYALSEALRCGCVPIVTDIPSFRMMTAEGRLGALWEAGNKDAFAEAVAFASGKPLRTEANNSVEFFKNNLSFDAIAGKAIDHYQAIKKLRVLKKAVF